MSVASIRYGTRRLVTAPTTESFEGWSRHEASTDPAVMVAAVMDLLGRSLFSDALPGSRATLREPLSRSGPDPSGRRVRCHPTGSQPDWERATG